MQTQLSKTKWPLIALALALCSASSVSATEKIIVYRSQYERDMDAFWYDHPEIILWGLGLLVAAIAVGLAVHFFGNRRNRW